MEFGKILTVPRAQPGLEPMRLDLTELQLAESRTKELAYVNKETAQELMYMFNHAYAKVHEMLVSVRYEFEQAQTYAARRKAIVLLDIAPNILKEKGLLSSRSPAGSEDLRQSVLDIDAEYFDYQQKINALKALYQYLQGKTEALERNYYAAKKSLDQDRSIGNVNNFHDEDSKELAKMIGNPRI